MIRAGLEAAASRGPWLVLAAWVLTAATGDSIAARATRDVACDVAPAVDAPVLADCTAPAAVPAGSISMRLVGTAPDRVRAIELRWGDEREPFQIIDVSARPVIDLETVGVVYLDMNFDGHRDLAIMRALTGDNAGYRHFVYLPGRNRFEHEPRLDALTWPQFSAARRRVVVDRVREHGRESAEYQWRGSDLVLVERTEWRVTGESGCVELRYAMDGAETTLTHQAPCE